MFVSVDTHTEHEDKWEDYVFLWMKSWCILTVNVSSVQPLNFYTVFVLILFAGGFSCAILIHVNIPLSADEAVACDIKDTAVAKLRSHHAKAFVTYEGLQQCYS